MDRRLHDNRKAMREFVLGSSRVSELGEQFK